MFHGSRISAANLGDFLGERLVRAFLNGQFVNVEDAVPFPARKMLMRCRTVEDAQAKLRKDKHIETVRIKPAVVDFGVDSPRFRFFGQFFEHGGFSGARAALDENPRAKVFRQVRNVIEGSLPRSSAEKPHG